MPRDGFIKLIWKSHIFWAFVFAILVGIPIEHIMTSKENFWQSGIFWIVVLVFITLGIFFECMDHRLEKRGKSIWIFLKEKWMEKVSPDRPKTISERELKNTIISNIDGINQDEVIFSIDEKSVLTSRDKSHYSVTGYHFKRFLNVLPILNGEGNFFFAKACTFFGNELMSRGVDSVLYFDKDSDFIFCNAVASRAFPKKIKQYSLGYNEHNNPQSAIIYRESQSLAGQNVAFITALSITDKPLLDVAEFLKDKGANLVTVVILFNALGSLTSLRQKIGAPIISAFDVDLKRVDPDQCSWCDRKLKKRNVKFQEY